jgi:hypothetical protein
VCQESHETYACEQSVVLPCGIADNLGPLLARILAFNASDAECCGVIWTVHGEEEIGSPWAHKLYPTLRAEVPEVLRVELWIEETGYFCRDGSQRVLLLHEEKNQGLIRSLMQELEPLAKADLREVAVEHRALNKAFGLDKCPCLTHLLDGKAPYIAIGINDSYSNIHTVDESVPNAVLALADAQFQIFLTALPN